MAEAQVDDAVSEVEAGLKAAKRQRRMEQLQEIIRRFLANILHSKGNKSLTFDAWNFLLSELDRKIHILKVISVDDIWLAVGRMKTDDIKTLAAIFKVLSEKIFPSNYDEKLHYLRRLVGHAALGQEYALPSMTSSSAATKGIAALKSEGLTLGGMREAGFHAIELLGEGYTAFELFQAGFTLRDLRGANVTVKGLVDGGFVNDSDGCIRLRQAGYTMYDISTSGLFTSEQCIYAGYPRREILDTGMTFKKVKGRTAR
ncbi:hypothetical protein CYMTET_27183 [Cymbomonas tetramitiformis]|uniref:Uncharacterized protein n=1 Tax=Cymbomonas tetramitiformis TaxID=36881 RepID=A0AAE0FQA1_9CHLO|nr:hypothetical protein CYMTET_27183 [Cymbomonas tetramitiformis]